MASYINRYLDAAKNETINPIVAQSTGKDDIENGSSNGVHTAMAEEAETGQPGRRKLITAFAAGLAVAGVTLGVVGGLSATGSPAAAPAEGVNAAGFQNAELSQGVQAKWFWEWWGHEDPCQTVEPIEDVDLDEFIRATWYVQQQQLNTYQREDDLYCVAASYVQTGDEHVPFFDGNIISVYNYGNSGGVNGEATNSIDEQSGLPGTVLCARQPDEDSTKLLVAPCWLPNLFGGDYWIVGLGVDDNNQYEWAVVSGGQPAEEYDDGCTTGDGYFNSGLWIFARDPVLSDEKLAEARAAATKQGFTLSQLYDVQQEGCNYEGALIKN